MSSFQALSASGSALWRDATSKEKIVLLNEYRNFYLELSSLEASSYEEWKIKRTTFLDFILSQAWASSNMNCIYAGWPSMRVGKFCSSPQKNNPQYLQGSCGPNQMQCQPLLFGKNLCVLTSTREQRNMAFANCNQKFLASKKSQEEIIKEIELDGKTNDLLELMDFADNICHSGKQAGTGMCNRLISRVSQMREGVKVTSEVKAKAPAPGSVVRQTKPEIKKAPSVNHSGPTASKPKVTRPKGLVIDIPNFSTITSKKLPPEKVVAPATESSNSEISTTQILPPEEVVSPINPDSSTKIISIDELAEIDIFGPTPVQRNISHEEQALRSAVNMTKTLETVSDGPQVKCASEETSHEVGICRVGPYTPQEALKDINAGNLQFLGRDLLPGSFKNRACVFKSERAYVLYYNCMADRKEAGATDIEVISFDGDIVRFYVENSRKNIGRISQLDRSKYNLTWTISYSKTNPPGNLNLSQIKAFKEKNSFYKGTCWVGTVGEAKNSNAKADCYGTAKAELSTWAPQSEKFWINPGIEWLETQQYLRKQVENAPY